MFLGGFIQAIGYGGAGAQEKAGVVVTKGHVQILPSNTTAASRSPAALEATDLQSLMAPTVVSSIQSVPLFVDFQIFPPSGTATMTVPSLLEAMSCQFNPSVGLVVANTFIATQVAPLSIDRQMSPASTTATIFVPSPFEAMPLHC